MKLETRRIESRGFRAQPERVRLRDQDREPQKLTRKADFGNAGLKAMPKSEPKRNRALLDMANGQACLLRVPHVCNGDKKTTVACHSNLSIHGKAGARKADDEYTVWGCAACHRWLDQGSAPAEMKDAVFMQAHHRQVLAWREAAANPAEGPRSRRAALWALGHLEGRKP
jgi:hypothetical protein